MKFFDMVHADGCIVRERALAAKPWDGNVETTKPENVFKGVTHDWKTATCDHCGATAEMYDGEWGKPRR